MVRYFAGAKCLDEGVMLYGALSYAYLISLRLDSFGLYDLVSPPWSYRVISSLFTRSDDSGAMPDSTTPTV
jgi:hypothetical protein